MMTFLRRSAIRSLVLCIAAGMLAACGGTALPKSQSVTRSLWRTFDEVKAVYDKVQPGKTTEAELRSLGFDPYANANMRVMNYLDVMRQFLKTDGVGVRDLDPAVQRCLAARESCAGYQVSLERIDRERKGSALADLFNFRRQTHETGWSFSALFVLQDGAVTYKLWSGVPRIDRLTDTDNPLGPVQEPATIIRDHIP